MTAYSRLEAVFRKSAAIGDALGVLQWDMATMMPDGGAEGRAEQMATLKGIAHETVTAPDMADLLAQAEGETLDGWERANLREMRREWVHAAAVPGDLVDALARAESACEMAWREARPAADFKRVLPALSDLLGLVRQVGAIKAEKLGVGIYDALLDQYEPEGRSAEIDAVFDPLEAFLPGFIEEALAAQARRPASVAPSGPFPTGQQKALGLKLMEMAGFDFHHGRLDVSRHPFCGGSPEDTRITTRYNEDDFASAMMGVLHETGHALYEFGLPKGRWRSQPVGRARGMVVHESQSLLMEMQACRSREFMTFAAPLIRDAFGGQGAAWEADNLYRRGIRVERGFIRVEADECTYPAHVIIRYRLEKALIEGRMELADLPGAWNEGYKRLLGITPPDDRLGCLQDIHWYGGSWGYFPTYTLGAMTAAQLFAAAQAADAEVLPAMGKGDFKPLLAWLRANVHGHGSSLSTRDLVTRATGRPLDPAVFEAHLRRRYLD
ncbi:carboxypeptidase M32 [Paramagnetospirillum kuznetsovii]|uniref:Metal-dependent carboxypeptidase n=1 Tax=Paramagnetospirillum kuznetsovii TaxID=2053833 RepID=A0A364NY83_9PROT|nr:carboxypeptidase M32 [Paramagnetospirillum kuznetsovii]RAU22039.1 carboxypeptidase M32 [Paramagnetospirillum kuznetsovii]